ncbi:MAG: RuvB-like domain-containing protein [Planctomycetota bacterium]|jgi:DNA polymerase III gamma/tau subunit
MQLYEQHRPKTLDAVIGQGKAVKTIKRLIERGMGGRALWISGASGTGKTTLARIVAGSIADDFYITEYDTADQLSVSAIDKLAKDMSYYAPGRGGRAYIINEAHGLRKAAIRRLLGLLEHIPAHIVVIFTTTKDGEVGLFDDQIDASPLLSRCTKIELTNQGLAKVFAIHCMKIATAENLNGKPLQSYVKLAAKCKNNCRAMLQDIEAGYMIGD